LSHAHAHTLTHHIVRHRNKGQQSAPHSVMMLHIIGLF
jgi:hypothetical protein